MMATLSHDIYLINREVVSKRSFVAEHLATVLVNVHWTVFSSERNIQLLGGRHLPRPTFTYPFTTTLHIKLSIISNRPRILGVYVGCKSCHPDNRPVQENSTFLETELKTSFDKHYPHKIGCSSEGLFNFNRARRNILLLNK